MVKISDINTFKVTRGLEKSVSKFLLWCIKEAFKKKTNKSSYFRVKLKRIKFELYTEPDLDQT